MEKRSRTRYLWNGIKSRTQKITRCMHTIFGRSSKYTSSTSENSTTLYEPTMDTPAINTQTIKLSGIDNTVFLDTSIFSVLHSNSARIKNVPESSRDNLEGMRQHTPSINSSITGLRGGELSFHDSTLGSQSLKQSRSPDGSVLLPDSESIKSSCSKDLGGSVSTCEWEYQEPFETYQDKVIKLCHDIGLGEPSKIERMNGGNDNRVICLSFTSSSKENQDYVLRIPRNAATAEIAKDQAAVLYYLASFMPVPTVMAFDSTSGNAIGCPYVIQQKLKGCNAAEIYYELPLDEKLEIITLVVDIITKLNASKADRPGQFVAGSTIPSLSQKPFSIPTDIDITGYRFEKDGTPRNMSSFENQPLASHLITAFEMRKNHDRDRGQDFMDDTWDELTKIVKQMDTAALFSNTDTDCVLWHWNLAFRNILVEKQKSGEWKLTGVLDWDFLLAVPLILTRGTPTWIWCKETDHSTEWFAQLCEGEIESSRELTTDELYLKAHFDKLMQQSDPNYMTDAYDRGVWIRRLAHFAVYGFSSYVYYDKQRELVSDWNAYYKSLGYDPDAEDSDDEDCNNSFAFSGGSSHSIRSQSSTGLYNQEGFDTYQQNVIQLCRDIGLGEPSKLERINGGSSNRVIGITFSESSGDRQFILRVPRFTLSDKVTFNIRDQVAAILTLRQHDFLCAPAIVAVDTQVNNAIESQYVLQQRLPGRSLQDVFFELPLDEKLEVTTMIAQFLLKMENISFSKPGLLTGTQSLPWTSTSLESSTLEPTISGFRLDTHKLAPALESQSLPSLILKMLEEQKIGNSDYQRPKWEKLICILKEMVKACLFRQSDSKNVLWHWDICARHILIDGIDPLPASDIPYQPSYPFTEDIIEPVEIKNIGGTDEGLIGGEISRSIPCMPEKQEALNSGWKVTGVIDWDDVMSVPLVISRVPRTWLWFNEENRGWTWTGNRDTPPERALTKEELTIKGHFDQIMQQADPEYLEDTYGRGVWIRRMFRFARDGFIEGGDLKRHEKFVKDWERYYSGMCSDTVFD